MNFRAQLTAVLDHDHGSSLVEMALVAPFLMLLLLGVVDFGRAFYLAMEIAGAAQAGAVYGAQNPRDSAGIIAAALDDAPDVPNLTVATPSFGCECSDGTAYSAACSSAPTCANNLVYRVKVTVSASYSPWIPWPGIPTIILLSNSAIMRTGNS
jgi:Flp pilus assembly protein TadG